MEKGREEGAEEDVGPEPPQEALVGHQPGQREREAAQGLPARARLVRVEPRPETVKDRPAPEQGPEKGLRTGFR